MNWEAASSGQSKERAVPDSGNTDVGWIRLSAAKEEKFFCGVTLRFKTNDCGPSGQYQYAMAVSFPFDKQLLFVSLEGQCWAHGPFPLPAESNAETGVYTVSVKWLRDNLHYIANIDDKDDVWYAQWIDAIPKNFS